MKLQKLAVLALLIGVGGCSAGGPPPTNAEIIQALDALNGGLLNVSNNLSCSQTATGIEPAGGAYAGLPYWDMDCKNFGGPRDSRVIRAWRHKDGTLNATATGA
jgi:hypothetical protein